MKRFAPLLFLSLALACQEAPEAYKSLKKAAADYKTTVGADATSDSAGSDVTPPEVEVETAQVDEVEPVTQESPSLPVQPVPQMPPAEVDGPIKIPTTISALQLVSTKTCVTPNQKFVNCVDALDVRTKFEAPAVDTLIATFPGLNNCLDLFNSIRTDGADVFGWSCTRNPEQQWKVKKVGAGTFTLESVRAPGQCLTLYKKAGESGKGRPQTFACANRAEQIFQFATLSAPENSVPESHGTDTAPKTVVLKGVPIGNIYDDTYTQTTASSSVVVYGSSKIPDLKKIAWVTEVSEKFWAYAKKTYGNFGNERLYVFTQKVEDGGLGGTAQSWQSNAFNYRNTIAIHYCYFCWELNDFGTRAIISHEIHHVVVQAAFNTFEAPGPKFWGDSTFADIFQYDMDLATGYPEDAATQHSNNMAGNKQYREMWYPLYSKFGRTQFLVNYFKVVRENWPLQSDLFYANIGSITLGEFALILSGAANTDARVYVKAAFDWTAKNDAEWEAARLRFPKIKF